MLNMINTIPLQLNNITSNSNNITSNSNDITSNPNDTINQKALSSNDKTLQQTNQTIIPNNIISQSNNNIYNIINIFVSGLAIYLALKCNLKINYKSIIIALLFPYSYIIYTIIMYNGLCPLLNS